MWGKIGVTLEMQAVDPDALTAQCCPAFDFDIMIWGWVSDPDPSALLYVYTSEAIPTGSSETGYSNPAYDELYAKQQTTLDFEARKDIVWEMQKIVHDDVVYIIPFYEQSYPGIPHRPLHRLDHRPGKSGTFRCDLSGGDRTSQVNFCSSAGAKLSRTCSVIQFQGVTLNRTRALLKKVAWSLFTILFVIVLNFFLFRVLPGDPARAGIRDPRLKKEAVEMLRVRFGLDKPVINCFESLNPIKLGSCAVNPMDTQFFIYVRNLLQGELGFSYHTNRPVGDILAERLWNTVLLIGAGQILCDNYWRDFRRLRRMEGAHLH